MTRESLDGPRARANAVWSLQQITEHQRTLDWLITNKASWLDTPFGSQLIYGTVRHYYSLGTIIEQNQTLTFYKENYPIDNPLFGFVSWKLIILLNNR